MVPSLSDVANPWEMESPSDSLAHVSSFRSYTNLDPFYQYGLTPIPTWIGNNTHGKMWNWINYPFSNFNGCLSVVWEWIGNFIPQLMIDEITCPYWLIRFGKRVPDFENSNHFADDIFKFIFMNIKSCVSIQISPKFIPKSPALV